MPMLCHQHCGTDFPSLTGTSSSATGWLPQAAAAAFAGQDSQGKGLQVQAGQQSGLTKLQDRGGRGLGST